MEAWTRKHEDSEWTVWPDLPRALTGLLDESDADVLLLSEEPDLESEELVATVRVLGLLGSHVGHVMVASPYPSTEWVERLRPLGVEHVWVGERARYREEGVIEHVDEVGDQLCPALHARTRDHVTLSVCGCEKDRMVLARDHLDRWCLDHRESCPHWKRGDGA